MSDGRGFKPTIIELARADKPAPLSAEQLRRWCDPASLPFSSTEELEPINDVIGQDSAMESLRFGMEIHAPGQNIFVRGLSGTGRMTLIRRLVEKIRPSCPQARDRCYVHHFARPDSPRLITLPRGQGSRFRRKIDELARFIKTELEAALSSEGISTRKNAMDQKLQQNVATLVEPFEKEIEEAGLRLVTIQVGPSAHAAIFPFMNGKPVPPEEWEQFKTEGTVDAATAERVDQMREAFENRLPEVMEQVNVLRHKHVEALRRLREQAIRNILEPYLRALRVEFPEESVKAFLEELGEDAAAQGAGQEPFDEDAMKRYRVNIVLSHDPDTPCPIIVENVPTMSNLLGTIDRVVSPENAGWSDHMMIRAGALLRADGGYLILEARDLLEEPGAWKVLVRTLKTGRLEIGLPESIPWWGPALKPEPIDIHVKVILLGDAYIYHLLDAYDAYFSSLFKVLADFDTVIPWTSEGGARYGGVLARIAREEGLPHFDREAVAALVEFGARIADRRSKLSTRFGRVADLAREAAFLARKDGKTLVGGENVRLAIRGVKKRAELPSKRFRDLVKDKVIRVDVSGLAVGQVNGLAVIQAGPLSYGFPARITATLGPGTAGVINIEREAELSGSIHTKGFYILGGLLRRLLRTDHPLAFHASVAFEQSYGDIDGDSASAAEICCLLSALTDIPLRQDLAMTGAIDQMGTILAIGAAEEKIEGFYDTCFDLGLTETQGVIVPRANAEDLMLREDVVQACREGRFHVYGVETIHQALELFTGVKAGRLNDAGLYPDDSLLGVAVLRAYEFWLKASQTLGERNDVHRDESSVPSDAAAQPNDPHD